MKNKNLLYGAFLWMLSLAPSAVQAMGLLEHIHPAFWWSGMKNTQLQILLHGDEIGNCKVRLSTPAIRILRTETTSNPNYLLLYVDLKNVAPQKFEILLTKDGETQSVPYEVRPRENIKRKTFDNTDAIYQLMPDRFANGNPGNDVIRGMMEQGCDPKSKEARHGGDIAGIVDHLDYFKKLGVTAICHTPMLENDMKVHSYHGYGITDYYRIDPRFGTNKEYKDMVSQAHEQGLKVIMEMVFNHCGNMNFLYADCPDKTWFHSAEKCLKNVHEIDAMTDLYAIKKRKSVAQNSWVNKALPDFNQENPALLTYLIQNSIWWIEYAGIDGISQDSYPYANFDAMAKWCTAVEREYPGFNIVGETNISHNVGVSFWQKDSDLATPKNSKLPLVMDFPLMNLLTTMVDEVTDNKEKGLVRIYDYLSQDAVYADPMHLVMLLGNPDSPRFSNSKAQALKLYRYKQALTLLTTLRGIPQLYYGDELGMYAPKEEGFGGQHQHFPGGFEGDADNCFSVKGMNKLQLQYFNITRRLLHWRKGNKVLSMGALRHFEVNKGVYVYARIYQGKVITILINGTDAPQTLNLAPYKDIIPMETAYDVLVGRHIHVPRNFRLEPRGTYILDFQQ